MNEDNKIKVLFYEYKNDDCFCIPKVNRKAYDPGGYLEVEKYLIRRNFEPKAIDNKPIYKINEKFDIIIITAPSSHFDLSEIETLKTFFQSGGRILLLHNDGGDKKQNTNLNEFLSTFGIKFNNDLIWSENNKCKLDWRTRVIISKFGEHSICKDIKQIWYWGCSLSFSQTTKNYGKNKILIEAPINLSNDFHSSDVEVIQHKDGWEKSHLGFIPKDTPYPMGEKEITPSILVTAKSESPNGGRIVCFGGRYTFNNDSILKNQFLFSWDTILENNNILKKFLTEGLNLKWAEKAEIEKPNNDKILLFYGSNPSDSVEIIRINDKTATLNFRDEIIDLNILEGEVYLALSHVKLFENIIEWLMEDRIPNGINIKAPKITIRILNFVEKYKLSVNAYIAGILTSGIITIIADEDYRKYYSDIIISYIGIILFILGATIFYYIGKKRGGKN